MWLLTLKLCPTENVYNEFIQKYTLSFSLSLGTFGKALFSVLTGEPNRSLDACSGPCSVCVGEDNKKKN